MKTSKQAHYHEYFEENKKNCRALWIGINEIANYKNKNKTNLPSSAIQDVKTITYQKLKISLNISTISSQVLVKNCQKNPSYKKAFFELLKESK